MAGADRSLLSQSAARHENVVTAFPTGAEIGADRARDKREGSHEQRGGESKSAGVSIVGHRCLSVP